jgi:uncharacterized membrane protein
VTPASSGRAALARAVAWRGDRECRRVALVALLFWAVGLGLALHRHHVFYTTMDQGIFNQVFWNGLRGRPFESSLSSTVSYAVSRQRQPPDVRYRRLGQHFTPTLMAWLPAYALWPSPATLIVLQTALVTAGGLVLHALARSRLPPPLAARIAIAYFAAQAVIGPTLSNFHDICQLPLLVFGLFLALERRRWLAVWVLALLVLGVREDAGLALLGTGLHLVGSRRHPRLGAALFATSAAYMLVVTSAVMPALSADVSGRFMVERFGPVLGGREATTTELVTTLAARPWVLLREIVTPVGPTLHYLARQWMPLAFVPAVSAPAWLLSAPPLLGVLLQSGASPLSMNIRYAMAIVPGLFYGAILWWARHPAAAARPRLRRLWTACMVVAAVTALGSNPHQVLSFVVPDSIDPWVHVPVTRQWARSRTLHAFVGRVPADASVSATARIVPQLSSRRAVTRFPEMALRDDTGEVRAVDYLVADVGGGRHCPVDALEDRRRTAGEVAGIQRLVREGRYGVLGYADGVVLAQRQAPGDEAAVRAWTDFLGACHPALLAAGPADRR